MKVSKYIMPIVCLCSLTACDSKVNYEKFSQAVDEISEHEYKKAIVKYSEESNNGKIDGKFTFTVKYGAFDCDDYTSYSSSIRSYLSTDVKDIAGEDVYFEYLAEAIKEDDPNAKIKSSYNYYINPFKVVVSFSSNATKDESTEERKMEYTYKFDKYGYITFMEYTINIVDTKKNNDAKITITTKQHFKMEVSYKD